MCLLGPFERLCMVHLLRSIMFNQSINMNDCCVVDAGLAGSVRGDGAAVHALGQESAAHLLDNKNSSIVPNYQ